ncbi:MAG: hypothetical protein WDN04_18725 [Rhodospirillales bacterium]
MPNCVYVGHSTGGMYLLSTPEVERAIVALALLSTAPDASWRSHYLATTRHDPLPAFDAALAAFENDPSDARLRDLAVASAEWNFAPHSLVAGRELLGRMPYNRAAADWSDANFDNTYFSNWFPAKLPTLILAGCEDRIVGQQGWGRSKIPVRQHRAKAHRRRRSFSLGRESRCGSPSVRMPCRRHHEIASTVARVKPGYCPGAASG